MFVMSKRSIFNSNMIIFTIQDWAKCPVTRRSVSRYCVFINGNLVSWKSKRQVTLSEAQYRSMASTTCEIMWIVKILGEFGIDNVVPVMHEKTKHFDIDVHLEWAKCPVTRRSVSRYCVFINGNLVSWKSKRQVTLSEAQYRIIL
ncbi:ribonuclease H-like domain-containing protein [Tanacetum coccineum]